MVRAIVITASVLSLAIPTTVSADRISEQQARARPIICKVFGSACSEALAVSWCESKWYVWAQNGQYKGLFQVSAAWRASVPGFGSGAWAQARHAYKVFKIDGSDWSAWDCQP